MTVYTMNYDSCGVPGVVLISASPLCHEEDDDLVFRVPRVAVVHAEIARSLVTWPTMLAPEDLAFLRSHLGETPDGLAAKIGVPAERLRHWEDSKFNVRCEDDEILAAMYEVILRRLVADRFVEDERPSFDEIMNFSHFTQRDASRPVEIDVDALSDPEGTAAAS